MNANLFEQLKILLEHYKIQYYESFIDQFNDDGMLIDTKYELDCEGWRFFEDTLLCRDVMQEVFPEHRATMIKRIKEQVKITKLERLYLPHLC